MEKLAFEIGLQFIPNDTFPKQPSEVGPFISIIAKNAIVIAGIIMIMLIVYGGLTMIANAGNSNPQNVAKSRQIITTGLIGFILIFASYWIVQAVEIITGIEIF